MKELVKKGKADNSIVGYDINAHIKRYILWFENII
jgi:hypothetical protein